MDWDHGYYSRNTYTSGFYRETAPNWIDFAALAKGHQPPRSMDGDAFRYLDLGCGTGFGLCLLAALYPEGEFVGVDFQPGHIAHAVRLAGALELQNVRFLEGDFLDLAQDPSPLRIVSDSPGLFHYVVAHGIATWVIELVQNALFELASTVLQPGGLFYCSYNTLPGWLHRIPLHHLIHLERLRGDPINPASAIQRASSTLQALGGVSASGDPTILAKALPQLGDALAALPSQDPRYLSQEYANAGWRPLFVAEMQEQCLRHKLNPVATASLPELFHELLPEPIRSVVMAEENPLLRETLVDLGIMQSFRRDLFCKGFAELNALELEEQITSVRIRRINRVSYCNASINCVFGTLSIDPELAQRFEEAMESTPITIGELSLACEKPIHELLPSVSLMIHANRWGLDRGPAGENAASTCQLSNRRLLELITRGRPYAQLAAPLIGNAVAINPVQAMLVQGLGQGLDGEILAICVQSGVLSLNRTLKGPDGEAISDPDRQLELLIQAQDEVKREFLPMLRALGSMP